MAVRLLKILAALLALVVAVSVAGYAYLRRSLPQIDGTAVVPGISAPVDIVRDADAIPHIFARTRRDALYGLGYVHAQDRLWQMEFQRRIGFGRLSEIFGRVTVPQDRFLRTVGFGRAARAAWDRLPPDARADVTAYIGGINAFIAAHHGSRLPPEFTLLRFEPEPWQGPDVLVWVKMMAWDLSRNYSSELLRHDLAGAVGWQKVAALLPPYANDGLSILNARDMTWLTGTAVRAGGAARAGNGEGPASGGGAPREVKDDGRDADYFASLTASLAQGSPVVRDLLLGGATTDALGSNNWVVDGTRTASGWPLLANDPHLDAHIPSLWYLAHLSAGDFDVIGATLPGTPAVAIGRNRRIAWGETNVAADVEDLYRERLDPTGRFAEFRGALEPLQILHESIAVKGGRPVEFDVRISRHGPLVSDAINANNAGSRRTPKPAPIEPLAFRWTALDPDDTTLVCFLRLNQAHDWSEFTGALRQFVVPSQNFVYADVDGHIGYYAPGRVPVRASGDGTVPARGWTGDAEWTGWIPFDQLPHTFDPPEHMIVTANNRPAPASYPHFVGVEWTEPFRAERIGDLLRAKPKATPDDFAAIQADRLSLHAASLLPALLSRVRPRSDADRRAIALLTAWNRTARADSAATAIFGAWFEHLTPAIAGDELGPRLTDYVSAQRTSFVARFVATVLAGPSSAWCDDVRTPARETCDDVVSAALHDAVGDLTRRLGRDMTRWRWDRVHRAVFPHQGLDAVALLRPLVSRSVPNGGDWSTVDVGGVSARSPYEQHAIPGYRQIIDLSPRNDSRFLDAVGESGHFLSPHYDDFLPDWRAVRHRPMRMTRKDAEAGAIGTLRLMPER
ncbi:MAG: penicillin acylase family protein [Betaproteobacteria bacterium]